MNETTRTRRQESGPDSGGIDEIAGASPAGGMVTVSHGVHHESLPVGGMSVGEIRRRFGDRFDIDPRARAEVDGRRADDRTTVRPGQLLVFANRTGEKGR
jgi:hypothetical protein